MCLKKIGLHIWEYVSYSRLNIQHDGGGGGGGGEGAYNLYMTKLNEHKNRHFDNE